MPGPTGVDTLISSAKEKHDRIVSSVPEGSAIKARISKLRLGKSKKAEKKDKLKEKGREEGRKKPHAISNEEVKRGDRERKSKKHSSSKIKSVSRPPLEEKELPVYAMSADGVPIAGREALQRVHTRERRSYSTDEGMERTRIVVLAQRQAAGHKKSKLALNSSKPS
jgi:hypothetical protein